MYSDFMCKTEGQYNVNFQSYWLIRTFSLFLGESFSFGPALGTGSPWMITFFGKISFTILIARHIFIPVINYNFLIEAIKVGTKETFQVAVVVEITNCKEILNLHPFNVLDYKQSKFVEKLPSFKNCTKIYRI